MLFTKLFSADWSRDHTKRWVASATLVSDHWIVEDLSRAGSSTHFLDRMFRAALDGAALAGFDFPIGLPYRYGQRTGFPDFPSALAAFGTGRWASFYDVAESSREISLERPFYPRWSTSDAKQTHLVSALGVSGMNDLRRSCELPTSERNAACPLFWTLGANQVGKAAIAGWQEIVGPAVKRDAKLWPFDGTLQSFATKASLVIAETYPAEAYHHLKIGFSRNESKRRTTDRARRAPKIFDWAATRGIEFSSRVTQTIADGCGDDACGEDRFDALLALFSIIEVVLGRRPEGTPEDSRIRRWEGWIIGQSAGGRELLSEHNTLTPPRLAGGFFQRGRSIPRRCGSR